MVEQLRKHRLYILMFSLNLAVLIGVIYLLRRPEPRVIAISTPLPTLATTTAPIKVEIGGAVVNAGVYTLNLGSHVSDALDAAGGVRPEADLHEIDLASKLSDGDAILVPTLVPRSESPIPLTPDAPVVSNRASPLDKIDINSATVEQLDALPNIGPVIARRIVDYRSQVGPFKNIEDIKQVKGIGDAIFEDVKDLIVAK